MAQSYDRMQESCYDQSEDLSLIDEGHRETLPNPTTLKNQKSFTTASIVNEQENNIRIWQVKNPSKGISNFVVEYRLGYSDC